MDAAHRQRAARGNPEVLHLVGLTPAQAVVATPHYPPGDICAALYPGYLIDRFGPERAPALHGILFIAPIGLVAMPYVLLCIRTDFRR